MWCQGTCLLFVIFLSSCESRKIDTNDWNETTSRRLTPRTYHTVGEIHRKDGQNTNVDIELLVVPSMHQGKHSPLQGEGSSILHVSRTKSSRPHKQNDTTKKTAGSFNTTKEEPNRRTGTIPGNERRFLEPMPDNCPIGSTVCEALVDGYPYDLISKVLQEHSDMFWALKGDDVIPDDNIASRIGHPIENSICPSNTVIMHPHQGFNKDDKWLYIVNHPEFVQGVKFETCLHNNACGLTEGFPLGYNTYCKQKYIYRRMLVVNGNGDLVPDEIKIPSCCSCFYHQDLASRMAILPQQKNMTPAIRSPKTSKQ